MEEASSSCHCFHGYTALDELAITQIFLVKMYTKIKDTLTKKVVGMNELTVIPTVSYTPLSISYTIPVSKMASSPFSRSKENACN